MSMPGKNESQLLSGLNLEASGESRSLRRRLWWNWLLLSSALAITTVAFGVFGPTFGSSHLSTIWPWANTDTAVVVGYTILIFCLIAYLTYQQRVLSAMSTRIISLHQRVGDYRQRQGDRLFALFDVSRVMEVESDPKTVFDRITSACVETFQSDQASLMLFHSATGKLHVRSANGHLNVAEVLGATQNIGEGIAGWVAANRKALIIGGRGGMNCPDGIELHSDLVSSAMVVPITIRDELVGVLNVSSRNSEVEYDEHDLRAMEVFAANAGTCIRHAEQSAWMRQTIRKLQRDSHGLARHPAHGPGS